MREISVKWSKAEWLSFGQVDNDGAQSGRKVQEIAVKRSKATMFESEKGEGGGGQVVEGGCLSFGQGDNNSTQSGAKGEGDCHRVEWCLVAMEHQKPS